MNDIFINKLKDLFDTRCSLNKSLNSNYSKGEDIYDPVTPLAVLFPISNEEISQIVKICSEHNKPIVPYGAGSSLEGNVVANERGITISLEKMNKILEINSSDFDCRVQAGVTRKNLNEQLKDKGIFFPIDPGADASIGGMASTSASGTMAVKFGTMKSIVTGLTVVLSSGEIIKTGTRAKKNAAGYNLTNLFVGSEGTLGIVTEVHLKLFPIPESIISAICQFPDLEAAIQTAQEIMQYGIDIARIELLNKDQMEISIDYSNLKNIEALPTLFFEFQGSENYNKENISIVENLSNDNKGSKFIWAIDTDERSKIWKARHEVYYASKILKPNSRVYTSDICVPISNLKECIIFAEQEARRNGITAPIVGHVGDGNFHVNIVYDPMIKKDYQIIRNFSNKLVEKALSLEGTVAGEHGVGLHKKEYLLKQYPDSVNIMRSIKKTLDPKNIFNPGKIFDF